MRRRNQTQPALADPIFPKELDTLLSEILVARNEFAHGGLRAVSAPSHSSEQQLDPTKDNGEKRGRKKKEAALIQEDE